MRKKKVYTIEDNLYGIDTVIFVGTFREATSWAIKKYDCSLSDLGSAEGRAGCSATIMAKGVAPVNFIWLREWPATTGAMNMVIHELAHIAHRTMDFCRIDDEEAYCYYLGFLFQRFLEVLKI